MQKCIAILLAISLMGQGFLRIGIVAWFQKNQSYIAANLCENRSRPELGCKGKCFLKKQLKKADDRQQQSDASSQKELVSLWAFIVPVAWQPKAFTFSCQALDYAYYLSLEGILFQKGIFRPPTA